ncbi:Uncharacterised protein [Bacteroides uniformis]|uniref:SGNH/GDSL hydrolase family protein n=1 Tax=Bacteroides uniformis TaxID=820 RepID=A0A174GPW7_BACUN|nr:SGNH/GDSL hydrolase family protein [Bacteroides uniformis]KAB4187900.1 SGNH/GDSL hydrolase family protein [Bacteroides uniformis]MUU00264.1 SGNH/GDSL hydrolase family protein [Bacteroides uniformis]CUO64011.1 Uncharacterised protein [Bacteroides uniformis]
MNKYIKLAVALMLLCVADYAGHRMLKYGLDKGMGLNEHSKVLIIGHSQLMMGLNKNVIEEALKCKVTKHTRAGVGINVRMMMTNMYVNSEYSESLKCVVLAVDPFSFNNDGLSLNSFMLFYPWMDEPYVGEFIHKNTDDIKYWGHKIFRLSRYSDDLIKQSFRGWKNDDRNYKTSFLTEDIYERGKDKWERPIKFDQTLMRNLEETIRHITSKGIHVVLLQSPSYYKLTESQQEKYEKILVYFQSLANSSSLIKFIDYDKIYNRQSELFFDPLHLNVEGQQLMTKRLINDIKDLTK